MENIDIRRSIETVIRQASKNRIAGTASVTYDPSVAGTEYRLYGNTYERIAPNAFDEVLRKQHDVICNYEHIKDIVLGRTPDSLILRTDLKGLHFETTEMFSDQEFYQRVLTYIDRKVVRGASFYGIANGKDITHHKEGDKEIRTINNFVSLHDVAVCLNPAYTGSQVLKRSHDIDYVEEEKKLFYREIETMAAIERAKTL